MYLVRRQDNPETAAHAREALNFHISVLIYSMVLGMSTLFLMFIPFLGVLWLFAIVPAFAAIGIGGMVLSIVAAVQSSEGKFYHYPLTMRLV